MVDIGHIVRKVCSPLVRGSPPLIVVPPDIGAQLITALSNQGKLVDLEEITDRLARIEKQLEPKK